MKRTLIRILLAGVVFSLAWGVGARAEVVDGIAATVDDEVILLSDVMREVGSQIGSLDPKDPAARKQQEDLLRATLEQAIEEKILVREAMLAGVEIRDNYVEDQIKKLRDMYPTNEAFLAELEQAGETMSDFRERLRKSRLAQILAYTKMDEFEKGVVVAEAEVAQYYADHQDEFSRAERIRLRQIFLPATDAAARAQAKQRLEQLKSELDGGADFAELAKAHSQAPGAAEGGIIGWVERGDLVLELETAAFALGAGAVSAPVETAGGVSLLKVDEYQAAGLANLDEMRTEIEPMLRRKAAFEHYNTWLSELRKRRQVRVFI